MVDCHHPFSCFLTRVIVSNEDQRSLNTSLHSLLLVVHVRMEDKLGIDIVSMNLVGSGYALAELRLVHLHDRLRAWDYLVGSMGLLLGLRI